MISIDIAQDPHNIEMFNRYAERYGGNSAAAHSMMSAELARQALRPSPRQSGSSALPLSFDEVRADFGVAKGDLAEAISLDSAHRGNDSQVQRSPGGQIPGPRAPKPQGASKAGAEHDANALRSSVQATQSKSTDSIGGRLVDGTLTSDRSLLLQSTKQAGKDATKVGTDSVEQLRRWLAE